MHFKGHIAIINASTLRPGFALLVLILILAMPAARAELPTVEIHVATVAGLRLALDEANDPSGSSVNTRIILTSDEYVIDEELPPVRSQVELVGMGEEDVVVRAADGYMGSLILAEKTGTLTMDNLIVRDFKDDSVRVIFGKGFFNNSVFENNSAGSGSAILVIGAIKISIVDCIFRGNESTGAAMFSGGAIKLDSTHVVDISGSVFSDNTSVSSAGAIVLEDSSAIISGSIFENNTAAEDGGAIYSTGDSNLEVRDTTFKQNRGDNGGAIGGVFDQIRAEDIIYDSNVGLVGGAVNAVANTVIIRRSIFRNNTSTINQASHVALDLPEPADRGQFFGNVLTNALNSPGDRLLRSRGRGQHFFANNSAPLDQNSVFFTHEFFNDGLADGVSLFNNASGRIEIPNKQATKTKSLFEAEGSVGIACQDNSTISGMPFESAGHNIFADDSCPADGPADMNNTDPMFDAVTQEGLTPLLPGSPAIDSGASDVIIFAGDTLATLPCDYRDLTGIGRPQDANGDGVFECDRGAIEVPGAGSIVDGHSAAFFNLDRDNEGTYVELLDHDKAVVYTFTFRPDGSGPAWFVGLGNVMGNSIVIDDLQRPVGTSFGEGFDPDQIERTPIGGMSMVFADCKAAGSGGNVAYSGDIDLGYEGLITRATRLTNILGCGALSAHPNAGLSGSYYLPTRSGEGLVIQWLPNGQVVVIFFTYDQNDNQLWVFGVGTADGNSVSIDALYPTTYTSWGRGFNTDEVTLTPWGTFTLTWTSCNTLTFSYTSLLGGFGEATRTYSRLTSLSGTTCPTF